MSRRRQDLFKKKAEERLEKAKELLKEEPGTPDTRSRKRGLTHFGMAELQQTKEELEKSQALIAELQEKLKQAQANASDQQAFQDAISNGTLIAELSPDDIIVADHDRDEIALKEPEFDQLVASIEESGQLIPIVVRPLSDGKYQLIAGFRRLNACRQLGRSVIASVMDADDTQAQILKAIENHVRTDLTVFERADSYVNIIDNLKLATVRGLAQKLGVSRSEVSRIYRIGKYIPKELKDILEVVERIPGNDDEPESSETIKRHHPTISLLETIVEAIVGLESEHNISRDEVAQRISADFKENENQYGNDPLKRANRILKVLGELKGSDIEIQKSQPSSSRIDGFISFAGKSYPVRRNGKKIAIEASTPEEARQIEQWLFEQLADHGDGDREKTNTEE